MGRPAPAAVSTDDLLDVAVAAARASAAVLLEYHERGVREVATKSTPTDLVSEADLEAERAIRELLAARRPDDAILGEEGDDVPGLHRAALGRRPARRHHQLPVRDPAVVRVGGLRGPGRRRPRSAARRALHGARRGAALLDGEPMRRSRATTWHGDGGDRLRLRRPRARGAGRGRGAAAAAGARHPPPRARRRSTSRGSPPGATTPTTSTASTRGTGRRARCSAARSASRPATSPRCRAPGPGSSSQRPRSSTRWRRSSPNDVAGAQADGAQAGSLAGGVAHGQLLAPPSHARRRSGSPASSIHAMPPASPLAPGSAMPGSRWMKKGSQGSAIACATPARRAVRPSRSMRRHLEARGARPGPARPRPPPPSRGGRPAPPPPHGRWPRPPPPRGRPRPAPRGSRRPAGRRGCACRCPTWRPPPPARARTRARGARRRRRGRPSSQMTWSMRTSRRDARRARERSAASRGPRPASGAGRGGPRTSR